MGGLSQGLSAASRLVALSRTREAAARRHNPLGPLVHLLVNMFLCAFSQKYLADDPDGVFLPLFITVQCSLSLLITLSFVGGTRAGIVRRTRLLPGAASAGHYFHLAGSLRRPELSRAAHGSPLEQEALRNSGVGPSVPPSVM